MEQAASGIGHNVNVDKTNTCSLIKKEDISTLNASSLKLVDKFMYLGNCYWKWLRHAPSENMDCYRDIIDYMEVWPIY